MRAPHPSVRHLYAAAATPSQAMARLRRLDEHLAHFDVALIPGGKDGDALFIRLTRGLQLGDLLDAALARLHAPAPPGSAPSIASDERANGTLFQHAESQNERASRDDFSITRDGTVQLNQSAGDSPLASKTAASAPAPAALRNVRLSSDAPRSTGRATTTDRGANGLGRVLSMLRMDDAVRGERNARTHETPAPRRAAKRPSAAPPLSRARRRSASPQLHLAHDIEPAENRSPTETRSSGPRGIASTSVSQVKDTHTVSPPSRQPSTANRDQITTASRGTRGQTIDRQTAHAVLLRRAARRDVTEALGQRVGRDVSPRVAAMLRRQTPNASSLAPASAQRGVDAAAPLDPLQRVVQSVDRVERSTARRTSSAARPAAAAAAHERVAVVRDDTAAHGRHPASSPQLSLSQVSSPRPTGFRGLVARVEAQHARVASGATAAIAHEEPAAQREIAASQETAPHRATAASVASAPDDAALIARIGEMLRRDAERHGIDLTGVEP